MKQPVIGIVTVLGEEAVPRVFTNINYPNAVIRGGGGPVMLPVTKNREILSQYLAVCDGFLFSGGQDISPCKYGELPSRLVGPTSLLLDDFQLSLMKLVLEAKKDVVPSIVRAGKDTVGLRCPAHPLTLSLLERARLPLAGPSANPSGAPSPTTAQQVLAYFDGQIEGVIDGGECTLSRESTILDLTQKPFKILREGALAKEEIENALLSGVRLIGVTGGSGSGKTTVTQFLAAQGVLALDCDKIYHELLETNADMLAEIEARFPAVFKNGKLDRKMLGAIVFAVPEALRDLNAITHRYVREDIYRRLREYVWQGGTVAVVDAIALFESGISEDCVFTVGVTAPDDERCARIMARDGIDADYALARIEAQPDDEYYEMRCDYLLRNDGTPEELKAKCRELFGIG